jgi:hypothetical protein
MFHQGVIRIFVSSHAGEKWEHSRYISSSDILRKRKEFGVCMMSGLFECV